jgi:hypothetical protein
MNFFLGIIDIVNNGIWYEVPANDECKMLNLAIDQMNDFIENN